MGNTFFTVGNKLIFLIGLMLIGSIVAVTYLSVQFFREDNTLLVQQLNSHEAHSLARETKQVLQSYLVRAETLAARLISASSDLEVRQIFAGQPDVLAFSHFAADGSSRSFALDDNARAALAQIQPLAASPTEPFFDSIQFSGGQPKLALRFPLAQGSFLLIFEPTELAERFRNTEGVTAYLLGPKGSLIAHSGAKATVSTSVLQKVHELQTGTISNKQIRYVDEATQEARLAAYRRVTDGGLTVVAEVPEDVALDASRRVVRSVAFLALIIICGSLFVGSFFSGLLMHPLRRLTEAALAISEGRYSVRVSAPAKGGDEIAEFSRVFNQMAAGLEERERFRETFVKFHSKEMAEQVLSGAVKLGGHRQDAIILFADLRDFTPMTESMEPEQVVEQLNEFLAAMVHVIRSRHGVIDKFVGDAILATWGVPFSRPEDARNAVFACLEMRAALEKLNEKRAKRKLPPLRFGIGLNKGAVIAGNVGSEERMEYTVIGDAVNTASRLESACKELNTDLVISASIRDELHDVFRFEPQARVTVKGKNQVLQTYRIAG